jgi:hypothetical protein
MDLEKKIRRILKEEINEMTSLENSVADFINMCLIEYKLPEGFYRVAVDIFPDYYGEQECAVTMLFKKPFKMNDSDTIHNIMKKIKNEINGYFGSTFERIGTSTSTVDNYMDTKWWYNQRKNK